MKNIVLIGKTGPAFHGRTEVTVHKQGIKPQTFLSHQSLADTTAKVVSSVSPNVGHNLLAQAESVRTTLIEADAWELSFEGTFEEMAPNGVLDPSDPDNHREIRQVIREWADAL